jgi:hypothetical protein
MWNSLKFKYLGKFESRGTDGLTKPVCPNTSIENVLLREICIFQEELKNSPKISVICIVQ